MKRKMIMVLILGISIQMLTACGNNILEGRKVIDKPGKQITVIENTSKNVYNDVALDKIEEIHNIRTLDWIDDNNVLIMKQNSSMEKIQMETSKMYPNNFYEYDIKNKKDKLIAGSSNNMGYGILSPNKKNIFYKEGIDVNLTGFILNRENGKKVKITDTDSISSTEGRWLDNNNVIFSQFPQGGIFTADIDGNRKEINNSPKGMISNALILGDKLYYTALNEKFYVQNLKEKANKLLKNNVIWFIPSADMKDFAMVKHTAQTKRTLYITDEEGNEKKTIAEGTQITGTSWSPDKSKIAYTVASENNGQGGLFVADVESGKTVQLTVDIQYAADAVRWSPNGKRLLVSNTERKNEELHFISYIIDLK